MHAGTTIALPKHKKGSKVLYKSRGSLLEEASILAVHFDDALEPYYTIRILKDGREKQTNDAHIIPISKEYKGSGSSSGAGVNGGTQTKSSHSYPVQQRRNYSDSCIQVDVYYSNNQPSGSDHLEDHRIHRTETVNTSHASDTTMSKLITRQQVLPTSILRPPSYGPIPRTDLTDINATSEDDNDYYDRESADSNLLKRKYGIFDRLRSYVSSFQSKTNKIPRMRARVIDADDAYSTNDLDETVHEPKEAITLKSSGAFGRSQIALSDSIEAAIANKSKTKIAPRHQSDKARSQIANTTLVFNGDVSVPLSRAASNDQEAISDEIQDKTIRNAKHLSKKRRVDHKSELCEQPPHKKARYNSDAISYVGIQNDNVDLSSRIGTRAYHRKNRCLYRPRIDKRYFERKHKKKDRLNFLNPVKRQPYRFQDQTIETSSCTHRTDCLFGTDCYDTLATSAFHNQSDLYVEISAKARHLRQKRQSRIPDKKGVELRSASSRYTAGQSQTKKANTPLIDEPEKETQRPKATQTACNRCDEAFEVSPSNEKTTIGESAHSLCVTRLSASTPRQLTLRFIYITPHNCFEGFAPTQQTVGQAQTKHANTTVIVEPEQETKRSKNVTQTAGNRSPGAAKISPSDEKKTFDELTDDRTCNQISSNLVHTESTRKQQAVPDFTFKYLPTPSNASDYRKAFGFKAKDHFPKRPRPYKPMVTFAPDQISRGTDSYFLRPDASHMLSRQEELPKIKSETGLGGLPFNFMPKEDKCDTNVPTSHNSKSGVFSAMKTRAIDLLAKLWRPWIESITIRSTISKQCLASEENATRNSKSRFILPKNFNRHPKKYPPKQPVVATSKPWNPDTNKRSHGKPGYVKNPKGLLPLVPSGWDSMFALKPGEWRCKSCNFKNPVDAMTCDCCTAVKVEREPTKRRQAGEGDSPDEWICQSCNSINPSCEMTCDFCTAVKVDRTVLTNDGDEEVSALTENETYSPSTENRPVKRSDPTESSIDGSTKSKRSKSHDVVNHQSKQTNDADERNSNKKHSIEPMDHESTTKRISLQHEKYVPATANEQHDTEDWMDTEMIPDSPNNRGDNMSE